MSKITITAADSVYKARQDIESLRSEYKQDKDDFDICKDILDYFLINVSWYTEADGARFNAKRLLNTINKLGSLSTDDLLTRSIDHKVKFKKTKLEAKSTNRVETITFDSTRGNVTMSIFITKVKTYCSKVEVLICDGDNKHPVELLDNLKLFKRRNYLTDLNKSVYFSDNYLCPEPNVTKEERIKNICSHLEKLLSTSIVYSTDIYKFVEKILGYENPFDSSRVNEVTIDYSNGKFNVSLK